MARCGCTGDTATTIVVTEDSECITHSGNGTVTSPLSAVPIISPNSDNLVECLDGLFVSNRGVWTPQDFGPTSTTDDAPTIQAALNAARDAGGGTVYIPPGVYPLASLPLRIYGKTRLTLAPGAILRRAANGTMLLNGDADQVMPGYSGHGDIIVEGGVWDCNAYAYPTSAMCMSFGHATNLLFRDFTIKDVCGYHGIEVNAVKTCVVSNCHGRGYRDPGGRDFSEFIQPDLAKGNAYFGGFGPYDDTPVLDLLVTGCTTGPSDTANTTAWPRGIGSHSASPNRPHRGIRIVGCRFVGCSQYAVGGYTWESVSVSDVQMQDCGGGVKLQTLDSSKTSHRTPAGGTEPTVTGSQPLSGFVVDNVTMDGGGSYGAALECFGEDTGFLQDLSTGRIVTRDLATNAVRMISVEDYRLAGVIAHTSGQSAISTLGTRRGRVVDCHVNGTAGAGITFDSRDTAAGPATDVGVVACTVTGAAANGIHIWGGTDLLVDGCAVYDTTGYGLQASTGTNRLTVRDTRTRNTTLTPINFTSTVTNITRRGNNSDAPTSTTTATAAGTSAETVVASWMIPAGDALPGTAYRFAAQGQASSTGTPTLTIRVRLGGPGGAVVASFAAVTTSSSISNRGWRVDGVLHAVAPGSSGTWLCGAQLVHHLSSTSGQSTQDVTDGTVTRDSTVDQALVVTAQWSASSASNTAQGLAANLHRT